MNSKSSSTRLMPVFLGCQVTTPRVSASASLGALSPAAFFEVMIQGWFRSSPCVGRQSFAPLSQVCCLAEAQRTQRAAWHSRGQSVSGEARLVFSLLTSAPFAAGSAGCRNRPGMHGLRTLPGLLGKLCAECHAGAHALVLTRTKSWVPRWFVYPGHL